MREPPTVRWVKDSAVTHPSPLVSTAAISPIHPISRIEAIFPVPPRTLNLHPRQTDWYLVRRDVLIFTHPGSPAEMDAIILAAGKGTRLLPYTQTTPKPLLPVRGRPILDWIIGALPPVDRLVVVVNYLAEQIEEYLAQQKHVRNWTMVRQAVPRGTGDALMSCRAEVTSDRFLVLNGDDLIGRADLARLATVQMGILASPVDRPEDYGILFRRSDGSLERLVEKPRGLPGPQLANIGAYLFPREVFGLTLPLSPRNEYEITDAVAQLAANDRFEVIESRYWLPIGNVPQWQAAEEADLSAVV